MRHDWADLNTIRRVLLHDVWAVVGLSNHQERPAYGVAWRLQQAGKKIVPIHLTETEVLGEKAYPSLCDVPFEVDVANMFRRSSEVGAHVDEAIDVGVKAVWLQLDVIDVEACQRAKDAGLDVVMDRCSAVELAVHR
jgi:predicted CoA-binding protein